MNYTSNFVTFTKLVVLHATTFVRRKLSSVFRIVIGSELLRDAHSSPVEPIKEAAEVVGGVRGLFKSNSSFTNFLGVVFTGTVFVAGVIELLDGVAIYKIFTAGFLWLSVLMAVIAIFILRQKTSEKGRYLSLKIRVPFSLCCFGLGIYVAALGVAAHRDASRQEKRAHFQEYSEFSNHDVESRKLEIARAIRESEIKRMFAEIKAQQQERVGKIFPPAQATSLNAYATHIEIWPNNPHQSIK